MRTAITVMAMISAVMAPHVVHSATTSFTCKFPMTATAEGPPDAFAQFPLFPSQEGISGEVFGAPRRSRSPLHLGKRRW
jgi:hypothetical protein